MTMVHRPCIRLADRPRRAAQPRVTEVRFCIRIKVFSRMEKPMPTDMAMGRTALRSSLKNTANTSTGSALSISSVMGGTVWVKRTASGPHRG